MGFAGTSDHPSTCSPYKRLERVVGAVPSPHRAGGGWGLLLFTLGSVRGASGGTLGKLDM